MSISGGVFDFFSDFIDGLGAVFSTSHENYVKAETIDDANTFVSRNGDLYTVIEFKGYKSVVSGEDFDRLMERLYTTIMPSIRTPGHFVRFIFERNQEKFDDFAARSSLSAKNAARSMNLDIQDVIDSHIAAVSNYCSFESMYIVIGTRLKDKLTKSELKNVGKEMNAFSASVPYGKDAQRIMSVVQSVRHAHYAFWQSMLDDLSGIGCMVEVVNTHDVLTMVRRTLAHDKTSNHWRPRLPTDTIMPRENTASNPNDVSNLLFPRIAAQILPEGAGVMEDARIQRIGSRFFAPVMVTMLPEEEAIKSFQFLFNSLSGTAIPYIVVIDFDSGATNALSAKKNITQAVHSLTMKMSLINRQIVSGIEEIESRIESEVFVKVKISGMTWADSREIAKERQSMLSRALQSWGGCDTSDVVGDPLGGVFACMPGVTDYNPAPTTFAPLRKILPMLPVTRMASPWKEGSLLLRTPDGKALPFQPGSSLQASWVNLVFAPMGFGKSVFLNAFNLATAMMPGATKLPIIRILDVGISSSGLVSLIKYALPESRRHLVQYYRLKNEASSAINVFDTPLGLQKPLPEHREFLINFLAMLCTPIDRDSPYDGIYGITRALVDLAYDRFSEKNNAKKYEERIDPKLHAILAGMYWSDGTPFLDGKTTWWEVVNKFFTEGFHHEAMIAQRYAVPVLADLIPLVYEKSIVETYKDKTDTDLPQYVWTNLNEAMETYPNLNGVTQFDIGEARIVSLDLQDVTRGDGPAAKRKTSIMYMIGRYTLTKDIFILSSDVKYFPEIYQDWHALRIREFETEIKSFCMDEFHRSSHSPGFRNQVETDIREGRKWRVMVTLVSQRPQDFTQAMVDLASTVVILGAGSNEMVKELGRIFGLNETELYIIQDRIRKPDARGSSMLAMHKTSLGSVSQYAMLTLAPEEMWAFTTTAEDRGLRDRLYEKHNPAKVRSMLSKEYPKGSCVPALERMRQLAGEQVDSDEGSKNLLDKLFNDMDQKLSMMTD